MQIVLILIFKLIVFKADRLFAGRLFMNLENSTVTYYRPIKVRDTEILATDSRQQYREKIARITLDSMVQFVGLLDARGTVLEINQVALDGGGLQLSDVEGKPFWTTFWWQFSEEINKELRELIQRASQGEFVRWDTEIYGRAGGKETIVIDASLCPVKDANGKVVFICAEGRDITEKKAQEIEIAQKNIELQSLLGRIRELDEIKTQFFANVSHELRTPLALIIGPAERLMKSDPNMNQKLQRDTAQVIVRNAKMLLKHVNDLLDISKLEANKLKIDLRETDVAELIRFVASHFDILANERQISFVIETESPCISFVDPEKLQRIVMNLLSNAFKFVPTGGSVQCRLNTFEKDLILSVEDSGPGVKPELRKAIFERFRQGDGAANRQFAGTGLGLAIAHEFVQMHKGTIEVLDSGLGGALFRVKFPKIHLSASGDDRILSSKSQFDRSTLDGLIEELRLPASFQTAIEPDLELSTEKEIVLVVEDNPDMNRFIAQSLAHDYQVITAFDGQEGLEKAFALHPALIVSDIMMPKVSGVQMISELRKHPEMTETPILLLSAKADEELKIQLLEESAQDFVTKPFNERDLQVRIRNLITVKKSREVLRKAEKRKREAVEEMNRDLRSRSKYLSELFEQTPSFMAVLRGPKHVFELANTAFYKLVGHRPLTGTPATEAFPEIKGQGFFELLDQVLASGELFKGAEFPLLLQREPGMPLEQRYVDFVFQPLLETDHFVTGIFIEGHDVTEEVIAKRRMEENEEKLNIVINASELGTWELNLKTKEVNYSDRYLEILGHEKGVKLTHEQLLKHVHPDDLPISKKAFEEAFKTGILNYESRLIWNDTSIHWMQAKGKLFYDSGTKPEKLIGTIRDITREKQYEEELLENEKKLDKLVKERTFQLERSNEDLQQFAHVASHDLKEPIRKIRTFGNRLQEEYQNLLPEKGSLFLDKILNATDRAYSMIDGVLSYSTMVSEYLPREIVNLNEVFKSIETDLELLIQEKKATLVIKKLPQIEGFRVLLYQLFYNLLNNSLKFSKITKPPVITATSSIVRLEGNELAKIVLRDNGIGFDNAQSENIFKTFTRLHSKDTYEGTGLGLALCKKIVHRHGGFISARGKKNKGAEFTVLLPLN